MKMKKAIIGTLSVSLLSTGLLATTNAHAAENTSAPVKTNISTQLPVSNVSQSLQNDVNGISNYFGLTPQESQQLLEAAKANNSDSSFETRGKLSWAVKALRAAWDKVPANVKKAIGGTAGFEKLLGVVDRYTGAVEDAVYAGALAVTGNETAAWWIAKTLCLLI
ncbi:hypothetical protein COL60_17890 [Bacillus pseudomycoides]|uniref:hypothetical protein n=1 Tax=Bacillus pseudomycoides TaxID=64104 RepID=UPI000BF85865|nr:hypothetical protein [Bacillus pseudomycoides]PFZ07903.1 hypothetical protein COL60_17890 [Bacillus pseudomycoides]